MKRIIFSVGRGLGVAGRATIALIGICGVVAALANYAMTLGSGTNFGSIVVSSVHYAQQLLCDPTTPSQCTAVSAGGAAKVDGSAVTQPVSGTVTANAGTGTRPVSAAASSISAGAGVDGWDLTQGAIADAAVTAGASGSISAKIRAMSRDLGTLTTLFNANGRATSANSSPVVQSPAPSTWHLVAAASNNATSVKASAATLFSCQLSGIGSAPAYLKIYNKASAPTPASDTVVKTLIIPAAGTAANGAGSNITFGPGGLTLGTGFATAVVAGIGDTDNTSVAASTYVVNCDYE